MIDLENRWIPEIVGYARLLKMREYVTKCWIHGDCGGASVISFDELIEQILSDLHSEQMLDVLKRRRGAKSNQFTVFRDFINALLSLDQSINKRDTPSNHEAIIGSKLWSKVEITACGIVSFAENSQQ